MFGRRKSPPKPRPAPCPECGKPTTLRGRFCRACGWDADHFGSEDAYLDGVSVPEPMDDDAYEDLIEDEKLVFSPLRVRARWLLVWSLVLAMVVAFVLPQVLRF